MHLLRRYVERIDGLIAFAREAVRNSLTQGVVLDTNPIWLASYHLAQAGLPPSALDLHLWPFADLLPLRTVEGDTVDFNWADDSGSVEYLTLLMFGKRERTFPDSSLPFVVKVIARPANSELLEARRRLVSLTLAQPFPALVETRPLGTLAASPGDSCVAAGNPGTIGGFLRDRRTQSLYAATCGHVASLGARVAVSGKHIGVCAHSHPPATLPVGQPCAVGSPGSTSLDLALIDLGTSSATNIVTGVAPYIASKQPIVLRGGKSGINSFEVGGLALTYSPGTSGVCFMNLFEVRPLASGGITHPRLRALFATTPTQGDSGGWLETTPKTEWCGVLVAADSLMGYALEADDVLARANAEFRTQLEIA